MQTIIYIIHIIYIYIWVYIIPHEPVEVAPCGTPAAGLGTSIERPGTLQTDGIGWETNPGWKSPEIT